MAMAVSFGAILDQGYRRRRGGHVKGGKGVLICCLP